MQYYGLIKQQTGEDWENAKISLSTAQPEIGGSAPSLPTRIIRFKRPRPQLAYNMSSSITRGGGGAGESLGITYFFLLIPEFKVHLSIL